MADRLAFEILAKDRASASFRAAAAGAADLAKDLDVAAVSSEAAAEALKKVGKASDLTASQSAALARVLKQTGSEEDKLAAKALLASAAVKRLDTSMAEAEVASVPATQGLSALQTPMAGLIGAGVALAPVLVTVGVGLAGFAAAAYSTLAPIEKAAQATGGLAANLGKLDPVQRNLAGSILGLGADFRQFSKSLQPQIFAVFGDGLRIVAGTLDAIQPVAKATGIALDGLLQSIDAEFRSGTWQQFFKWMAANAGPDIQQLGTLFIALANDIPPVLEELQPLASALLTVTTAAAQAEGALQQLDVVGFASVADGAKSSTSIWGKFGDALKTAADVLIPGTSSTLDQLTGSSKQAGAAAQKTGTSIKEMGGKAETSAQQVTDLYKALHNLLDPLTKNIQDAVTFKNDQVGLAAALKKSHDALGLHTAAQRASSQAAATAAQDALTLSQDILTQTGSASKAAKPLQTLAAELKNAGVHGGAAAALIRELEAAIAALHSKTITITVLGNGAGIVTHPGGGGTIFTPGNNGFVGRGATGGPRSGLTVVGERGAELVSLPRGSFVWNHAQTAALLSGHSGGSTAAAVIPRSSGSGGGITIQNLYVTLPHGSTREQGRHFVESILKFEQGSGSGWRR